MIRKEIVNYIETKIIPIYDNFDAAHQRDHVNSVIKSSVELAKTLTDIDVEMVYVSAAYHDLGLSIDRKTHHLESEKIVRSDSNLKKWFDTSQIDIIAKAARDHRASGTTPESDYGKIVSDADRDYNFEKVIIRCVNFRKELDFFSSLKEVRTHIREKYRSDGYLKEFYFREKPQEVQDKFDRFADDYDFALSEFKRIYGQLVFGMDIILMFDHSSDKYDLVVKRKAVRGVCIKGDQILMAHLENSGEYKFPGGGVNPGEGDIEALKREMLEEAGVTKIKEITNLGVALQKQDSIFNEGIFYQISKYYMVSDFDENAFAIENLDDYEVDLGVKPKWVRITDALKHNQEIMKDENRNPWVDRDTLILKYISEM